MVRWPTSMHSYLSEFIQICRAVATGFVIMGFIGYLVKLVHIPINNIVRICCFLVTMTDTAFLACTLQSLCTTV